MNSYHFTLIVHGPDLQSEELVEALYEAGCDDALVGRVDSLQYLDFDREASSLPDAVLSAVAGLESVDGVEVVRLSGAGLVSMSDIAKRFRRSRESVRLLISGDRGPGGFPPPVTDPRSRYRLWQWFEVSDWFSESFEEAVEDTDDHVLAAISAMLEFRRHGRVANLHGHKGLRKIVGL